MPLTIPPRKRAADEPREMVRVQLKPNDMRSYERSEAEELIAATPGAYIVGEQGDPSMEAETKAKRSAPNKARSSAETKSDDAETKSE